MIKNFALNGSQRLAMDKRIKEAKLNGGPAIPGIIQPIIPIITQITARIIKTIIAMSLFYIAEKMLSQKKKERLRLVRC